MRGAATDPLVPSLLFLLLLFSSCTFFILFNIVVFQDAVEFAAIMRRRQELLDPPDYVTIWDAE